MDGPLSDGPTCLGRWRLAADGAHGEVSLRSGCSDPDRIDHTHGVPRGHAVSPARSVRGRLADSAYLLDRALKTPCSAEDFARAALDTLRVALRPSYSALTCRIGSRVFHCGDSVLAAD